MKSFCKDFLLGRQCWSCGWVTILKTQGPSVSGCGAFGCHAAVDGSEVYRWFRDGSTGWPWGDDVNVEFLLRAWRDLNRQRRR